MIRPAAGLLLGIAAVAAVVLGQPALLEAWLTGFLLFAGLSAGALGVLAVGHLLREDWLAPVRAPLEAAALAMPLVAIMALPVLLGLDALYPWAGPVPPPMPEPRAAWLSPTPFRLRMVAILGLWIGLAWLLTRQARPDRRLAGAVLAAMVTSVTIAAQDWSLSRDPGWWGSLQGFAVWVEGMMAALAAAALVTLARGRMPDGETGPGEAAERGLLALGLATIWLWFVQFITVWMADLPAEAGWYLRRVEDGWGLLKLGVAVPALLLGLALAAPPRHRPWRMAAVCLLLLAGHVVHLWWAVRPDAPLARPNPLLDAAVLGVLGPCWAGWWWAGMRRGAGARGSIATAPDPAAVRPARGTAH
ncbi:MAG: hypothetical protein K2X49_19175 [Acetobacteraceae bacterium]|nr:hypothetical protein [Acetobacteraceae bacterium]